MDKEELHDIRSHAPPSLYPHPSFFNVYSKRDSNPEVRMTPLCMQRSVFVGSYEGLGD